MPRNVTGSGFVVAKIADQKTNTLPWRADIVDLNVQDIVLDSPTPLVQGQEVTCRAVLNNPGTVDAAGFDVRWELSRVGIRRIPKLDRSISAMLRLPVWDDSDDIQGSPTQPIQQVIYSHAALRSQHQNPSPRQFIPSSGKVGDTVTLFGKNLNVGTVTVRYSSGPGTEVKDRPGPDTPPIRDNPLEQLPLE